MSRLIRLFLLAALFSTAGPGDALGQVPGQFLVQGRLTDEVGAPQTGSATFTFRIYDAATGGSEVWPQTGGEVQTLNFEPDGLWSAQVGAVHPIPAVLFASDDSLWLEISVDAGSGEETLERLALLSVPFAFHAARADRSDTAAVADDAYLLGGRLPGQYADAIHSHSPLDIIPQGDGSELDADRLDGRDADDFASVEHAHQAADIEPQGPGSGLDADFVDGRDAEAFADSGHVHDPAGITPQGAGSGLDADLVDGRNADAFADSAHAHAPGDIAPQGDGSGLDADLVDGRNADAFADSGHVHAPGDIAPQGDGSGLDADLLDGQQAAAFAEVLHTHGGLWSENGANYFYNGGRVGVGTTSPEQMLHVVKGAQTGAVANSGSVAVFEGDNNGYLSLITPDFAERGLIFGEPASASAGGIYYNSTLTPDGLQFRTAFDATHMAIESSGRVSIGTYTGTGQLQVAGLAGNSTVTFPDNAIASEEILNEPGLVVSINAAVVTLVSTTMADVITLDIDIPTAGYILLEAKSNGTTYGTAGRAQGIMQIDETAGGAAESPYFATFGLVGHASTAIANSFPLYVSRVYFKDAAGVYTFRVEGAQNAGNNAGAVIRVGQTILTATFIPTSYNAVTAVVSAREAAAFSVSAPVDGDEAGSGVLVDLRELELRALRLRRAAENAERELQDARARDAAASTDAR